MHRGDEPRRVHVAAAFSQWPMGVGVRPSASHCMGYAVRVVNWTMVQWVRAGHSSLASGMVGAVSCTTIGLPFDVAKSRLQAGSGSYSWKSGYGSYTTSAKHSR